MCAIRLWTSSKYLRLHSEDKLNWADAKAALKGWTLWVHYISYAGAGCAITSLSLFSPAIVAGLGYEDLEAQLFTIPPYAVAYLATAGAALLSDRYHQRGLIAGCCTLTASLAFAILGILCSKRLSVAIANENQLLCLARHTLLDTSCLSSLQLVLFRAYRRLLRGLVIM
jgi:hypothetical protein